MSQFWDNEPVVQSKGLSSLNSLSKKFESVRSSFSGTDFPLTPVKGQIFYKELSGSKYDKYTYDGVEWVQEIKSSKFNSANLESPLTFPGGRRINVRSITEDDTFEITDDIVLVNADSGEITIGLPTASDCNGQIFLAKKIDASANLVNLSSADLIESLSVKSLSNQYDYIVLIASNGTWYIIT